MPIQPLQQLAAVRDGPAAREYGSLFVLLFASAILGRLLTAGVEAMQRALDPRLVGTVVYATAGFAGLATVVVGFRRLRPPEDGLERRELLHLAAVTWLVLLVAAYRLHGAADLPAVPREILSAVLNGAVAMALLALVYARSRGTVVRSGLPGRGALPLVGVVVLPAAVAGLGWVLAFASVRHSSFLFLYGPSGPRLSAATVVWSALVPAAFVGAGTAVLYSGAVQEGLRGRLGPAGAVAAVTPLAAVSLVEVRVGRASGPLTTAATVAGVVLLSLLVAVLAARGLLVLSRSLDVEPTPLLAAALGVLVLALPVLGLVGAQVVTAGFLASVGTLAATGGVAAVGYERSRSVWVPAVAFTTYLLVVDADVALYLAWLLP